MSALTTSGERPLETLRTNASNDNHRTDDTPQPSHWLSGSGLCVVGVVLVFVAAIMMLIYFLAASHGARGAGHNVLLGISACVLCGAAGAFVGAWMLAAQRAQRCYDLAVMRHGINHELVSMRAELDQTAAAMMSTASRLGLALDELPEQVRDRAAAQGQAVLAVTDGIERQLGEVAAAVQALGERLETVEATVRAASAAEAVMARVDGGRVVPMHPNGGRPHAG